jgi:hypothetical protein
MFFFAQKKNKILKLKYVMTKDLIFGKRGGMEFTNSHGLIFNFQMIPHIIGISYGRPGVLIHVLSWLTGQRISRSSFTEIISFNSPRKTRHDQEYLVAKLRILLLRTIHLVSLYLVYMSN